MKLFSLYKSCFLYSESIERSTQYETIYEKNGRMASCDPDVV